MSTANEYAQLFLEGMDALSKSAVNNSEKTLTIKGEIIEELDAGQHKYRVRYRGNIYDDAYSNIDSKYTTSTIVYMIVPDGDLSKPKWILGSITPSVVDYVSENETDAYIPISNNLFDTVKSGNKTEFGLRTWRNGTTNLTITNPNFKSEFADYLNNTYENYKTFLLSAYIKTNIDKYHQVEGDYGIHLKLDFLNPNELDENQKPSKVTRSYIINVSNMPGNPYSFEEYQLVNLYFTVEDYLIYDTSKEPSLSIFVQDFDYGDEIVTKEDGTEADPDILIKNISMRMIKVLTEQEYTGYHLTIVSDSGNYFTNQSEVKYLSLVLKAEGQVTKLDDEWKCYWFVRDSINSNSPYYTSIAGDGWRCLNERTNVTKDSTTGKETFQYKTNNRTLKVTAEEVPTALLYRCILIKENQENSNKNLFISGTLYLKNLLSRKQIFLESITGSTVFAKGVGTVTLRATIKTDEVISDFISYSVEIQRKDKNDNFISDFVPLNDGEIVEEKFYTRGDWCQYDKEVTEDGRQYYYYYFDFSFPCSKIDDFNIVACTFYQDKVIAATETKEGSIEKINLGTQELKVSTSENLSYTLMITGGNVLYKYDGDGDSPMSAYYDGPLESFVYNIEPLSFKIFDKDGIELTESQYKTVSYTWQIPVKSLINIQKISNLSSLAKDGYYYIDGYNQGQLNYSIANVYDRAKADGNILLTAKYDGKEIKDSASIYFTKDGESGTNGSSYTVVITNDGYGYGEKDSNGIARKLHMVWVNTKYSSGGEIHNRGWYVHNLVNNILTNNNQSDSKNAITSSTPDSYCPQFDIKVFKSNSEMTKSNIKSIEWSLFDFNETVDLTTSPVTITNTNKSTIQTCFRIKQEDNSGGKGKGILRVREESKYRQNDEGSWITNDFGVWKVENNKPISLCTIVQCKVKINNENSATNAPETIYAYYPIEMTWIPQYYSNKNKRTPLIPTLEGGFSHVLYTGDGDNPSYDNNKPFEELDNKGVKHTFNFKCVPNINDKSDTFLEKGTSYSYTWSVSSSKKNGTTYQNLRLSTNKDFPMYANITPTTKFDNGLSDNFVRVDLGWNQDKISEINTEISSLTTEKETLQTKLDTCIGVRDNNNTIITNGNQQYRSLLYNFYIKENTSKDKYYWKEYLKNRTDTTNQHAYKMTTFLKYRTQAISIIKELKETLAQLETLCQSNKSFQENYSHYTYNNICDNGLYLLNSCYDNLYKLGTEPNQGSSSYDLLELEQIDFSIALEKNDTTDVIDKTDILVMQLETISNAWDKLVGDYNIVIGKLVSKVNPNKVNSAYVFVYENTSLYNFKKHFRDLANSIYLSSLVNVKKSKNNYYDDFRAFKKQLTTLCSTVDSSSVKNHKTENLDDFKKLITDVDTLFKDFYTTEKNNTEYYKKIKTELENEISTRVKKIEDLETQLLPNTENLVLTHIKPIIMSCNRYGLAHLNGWDGNKLYIDEKNEQYALALQFGGGIKEPEGYTGVLMGVRDFNNKQTDQEQHIGLTGLKQGQTTFFLSANDGSLILGKSGGGQIIIDPNVVENKKSGNEALLYNKDYFYETFGTDQKPTTYANIGTVPNEKTRNGMLINLSAPYIHFGNSSTGKIYSGNHTSVTTSSGEGFCLSHEGLSIGSGFKITTEGVSEVIHEGSSIGGWKVRAKENVTIVETDANGNTIFEEDGITPKTTTIDEFGFISNDGKGIFMDTNTSTIALGNKNTGKIYSGNHYYFESTAGGFYLSSRGLSIGDNFYVSSSGILTTLHEGSNLGNWTVKTRPIKVPKLNADGTHALDDNGKWLWENKEEKGLISNNNSGIFMDAQAGTIYLGSVEGRISSGSHWYRDAKTDGFYLSQDGLSIGSNFSIETDGVATIHLGDDEGKIYSGSHSTLNSHSDGFYLDYSGLSIGDTIKISSGGEGKVEVGNLSSSNKYWTIDGEINYFPDYLTVEKKTKYSAPHTKNERFIWWGENGKESEKAIYQITVDSVNTGTSILSSGESQNCKRLDSTFSYISYGTKEKHFVVYENEDKENEIYIDKERAERNSVYIGTDGLRLGKGFAVDPNTGSGYLEGTIQANSGVIGSWTINKKGLFGAKQKITDEDLDRGLKGCTRQLVLEPDGDFGFVYYDTNGDEITDKKRLGKANAFWRCYSDGSFNVHAQDSNFGGVYIEDWTDEQGGKHVNTYYESEWPINAEANDDGVFRNHAFGEIAQMTKNSILEELGEGKVIYNAIQTAISAISVPTGGTVTIDGVPYDVDFTYN